MSNIHDGIDRNTWPEHVYRYVEHYFWEPQHLVKTKSSRLAARARGEKYVSAFYRQIRSQEVPLNLLLNLFLRVVPARVRTNLFRAFQCGSSNPVGPFQLLYGEDQKYTQPDVLLESGTERVLIEMKVGAHLDIEQIKKYCLLHAAMGSGTGGKIPYLLFLTPHPIHEHWKPRSEQSSIADQGIEKYIQSRLDSTTFSAKMMASADVTEQQLEAVLSEMRIGTATWQQLGDAIVQEGASISNRDGELVEVMATLTADFLSDLDRRELWKPSHSGDS